MRSPARKRGERAAAYPRRFRYSRRFLCAAISPKRIRFRALRPLLSSLNNSTFAGHFKSEGTVSSPVRTLDLNGAFFAGGTDPIPPQVGGGFSINGNGYEASGIFAGAK